MSACLKKQTLAASKPKVFKISQFHDSVIVIGKESVSSLMGSPINWMSYKGHFKTFLQFFLNPFFCHKVSWNVPKNTLITDCWKINTPLYRPDWQYSYAVIYNMSAFQVRIMYMKYLYSLLERCFSVCNFSLCPFIFFTNWDIS